MGAMLRERTRGAVARETTLRYLIRPARRADLDDLEWFGEHRSLRLVEEASWMNVEAGSVLFLVADANGFPVGQIKVALVHDESGYDLAAKPREVAGRALGDAALAGYLYSLRVFAPFRRLGIGSALIEHAEDLLRERGYRLVTIAAERENDGALRLYERLGYERIRERRRAWSYSDPEGRLQHVEVDEVLLRKEL